jgi:hypothetical protein
LKHRFATVVRTAFAAALLAGFVWLLGGLLVPAGATAAGTWSPIQPLQGFSGSRPNNLTPIPAADGGKLLYWTRPVGEADMVQAMRVAPDGTLGPIVDVVDLSAELGVDLRVVMDSEGEATFAWRRVGPEGLIRSRTLAPDNTLAPIVDISAPPIPNETVNLRGLSVAVAPDGTVGYLWTREVSPVRKLEGVTVPDNGPAGTIRTYTDVPFSVSDPQVAALPTNQFKIGWIPLDTDTGFRNVAIADIQADGAPVGEPVFLFPRTEPQNGIVNGTCQQLLDPVTNQPLTKPSGATGNPQNLQMGSTAAGAISIAWRRQILTGDRDCDGNIPAPTSDDVAVEIARIDAFGTLSPISRASRNGFDIGSLEIQMTADRRNTLTWFASNEDTNFFGTQIFRFSDSGVWTLSDSDNFVDPVVIAGADLSVGIGWTEGGDIPTQGTARAAFLTRNGQLLPAAIPGLGTLKASSEPLAEPGPQGRRSVMFYGLDQADVGSLYRTDFSDPGIRISPATVNFGRTPINTPSGAFRIFLENNGTTANNLGTISVTGEHSSQFQALDAAACVGELAPGSFCSLQIRFRPDSDGLKTAALALKTEAGPVSSELRGRGVQRTRLKVRARPVRRVVAAGKQTVFRALVTNRGGIAATGVRVCLVGPGSGVKPGRRCAAIGEAARGATRSIPFRIRPSRSASGRLQLMFRVRANNARPARAPAVLQIKR